MSNFLSENNLLKLYKIITITHSYGDYNENDSTNLSNALRHFILIAVTHEIWKKLQS